MENKSENTPIIENAVDNTGSLKESSLSSRDVNMVHQIYAELMKNDKNLQALDARIKTTNEETDKVTSQYDDIISKSETYYVDSKALLRAISDSLLKKEIEKEINISSEKYALKTKHIKELIDLIKANNLQLHAQYVAFMIRKTLPEIEKYQSAHPLKEDHLNNFINKQNKLLNELKNFK